MLLTTPPVSDFQRALFDEAAEAGPHGLGWDDVNRLAARWLWPLLEDAGGDTSSLGHELVAWMHASGEIEADLVPGTAGAPVAERVRHPQYAALVYDQAA